ncbi:hypothetical protein J1605_004498 [Eschrichtius robustus]|uniref:Uncharacterized protein n=1 Tax=Eschrichtius robustus TaxID=9764 RepID=A0AB34HHQ7_ESCRO|nr:hypothetical protein J1605_004498 [Eschrichtius robustus]
MTHVSLSLEQQPDFAQTSHRSVWSALRYLYTGSQEPGQIRLASIRQRMAEMQGLMERLERAVGRLELLSAGLHRPPGDCGEMNGVSGGVAPSVEAFDKLMNSMVAEFLKKSRILAGDVETHRRKLQLSEVGDVDGVSNAAP